MIVSLGPWPLGQDTVHESTNDLFQLPSEGERPPRALGMINVDVDNDGWPRLRSGTSGFVAATGGLGGYSFQDNLFLQDQGTIYKVNPSTWDKTVVVSGLDSSARVAYENLGGIVYWSNGLVCGTLDSVGASGNWGMSVPAAPTLGTVSGSTAAGRYQVVLTYEDGSGRESGAQKAGLVTLTDATKDITVDLTGVADASAAYVNVYASSTDQKESLWVKRVAVAALPTTITAAQLRTSTRPLRTQHLRGPIPCDGLFTYQGFLMLYRDEVVFRSNGLSPHLFNARQDVFPHPSTVLGGAGVADGFWVITEKEGLWWWSGEPGTWRNELKDRRKYAAGHLTIPGEWIPALQTEALVGLFVCTDGLVAGLPGGRVFPLTDDRIKLTVSGKRASIATRDTGKIRQVLWSLVD